MAAVINLSSVGGLEWPALPEHGKLVATGSVAVVTALTSGRSGIVAVGSGRAT